MQTKRRLRHTLFLEISLVLIILALGFLLFRMDSYKLVILNLFFLPIVLSGFFLGSYRSGVMAVLCVISAMVATSLGMTGFSGQSSLVVVGLAIAVWGAVLGLVAILVGTLSDERSKKIVELHEAYTGVVEVLSRYLQSGNPRLTARSIRVAELSQIVARQLQLSPKQTDDIRVAALLYDLSNVEVTTKVLKRAMVALEMESTTSDEHTFQGTELVDSLGSVLTGAMPLLAEQSGMLEEYRTSQEEEQTTVMPMGAKIIRAVRAYYDLTEGAPEKRKRTPTAALRELRDDSAVKHDEEILHAVETVGSDAGGLPLENDLHELLSLQS